MNLKELGIFLLCGLLLPWWPIVLNIKMTSVNSQRLLLVIPLNTSQILSDHKFLIRHLSFKSKLKSWSIKVHLESEVTTAWCWWQNNGTSQRCTHFLLLVFVGNHPGWNANQQLTCFISQLNSIFPRRDLETIWSFKIENVMAGDKDRMGGVNTGSKTPQPWRKPSNCRKFGHISCG